MKLTLIPLLIDSAVDLATGISRGNARYLGAISGYRPRIDVAQLATRDFTLRAWTQGTPVLG